MSELDGLKAIVTGGAEGIGRATANLMQRLGAAVAVLDRAIDQVAAPLWPYRAGVTE